MQGIAVLHSDGVPIMHGTLENLSQGGALVSVASEPLASGSQELELRLPGGSGRVRARTISVEPQNRSAEAPSRWRLAMAFEHVEPATAATIDAALDAALSAARRRAVLVIDDRSDRRAALLAKLIERGMTPLVPATPLEAIDLLSHPQLHVGLCLYARGFGMSSDELVAFLGDAFPWLATTEIRDSGDLDEASDGALAAWSSTSLARVLDEDLEDLDAEDAALDARIALASAAL